ncbi:MAG: scramblase [Myxococcales bacterium FL481]|nr:MAG: scramblase [Myxococcales bacterium FL481]
MPNNRAEISTALVPLDQSDGLMVEQQTEWHESFTDFETENRYLVYDPGGQPVYVAEEEGGGILRMLTRSLMNSARPFTMHMFSVDGQPVGTMRRPFRFYFHRLEVFDEDGDHVGTVQKRWSVLRRKYALLDPQGEPVFEVVGPLLKPWTFDIFDGEHQIGRICKRWSGLGREILTDADAFGVEYAEDLEVEAKQMLLATVFLIDFLHFENR